MDLWIRSQDRKRLTKVEDLYLVHDSNNFCDYIGNNIVGHLAKYTKKGRALEVLDQIHSCIQTNAGFDIYSKLGGFANDFNNKYNLVPVYEMPKE